MKKHMQEAALEVLDAIYPHSLTICAIENLAVKLGADEDRKNCGGWWYRVLVHAGLMDCTGFLGGNLGYALTPLGRMYTGDRPAPYGNARVPPPKPDFRNELH